MLNKAKDAVAKYINNGEKIALALSGGVDSMVLIHLILDECDIPKDRVMAVNVNHKIRKKSSDSDSLFVEQFCAEKGIEFNGFSIDVPSRSALSGHSIELEARNARLEVFTQLISTAAVSKILTAHHEQDNVETVMLNLFRGTGLNGLCGMEVLSKGWHLRPLLTTSKDEIIDYAKAKNIEYVTDETNLDNTFSRNFLRNDLLPKIREKWSGFDSRLMSLSDEIRNCVSFMDRAQYQELIIKKSDDEVLISNALLSADSALNGRIIINALKQINVVYDIDRKSIESIIELMRVGASGTELSLKNGLYAIRFYEGVMLSKLPPQKKCLAETPFKLKTTELDGLKICIEPQTKDNLKNTNKKILRFDADKVPFDAVWRFRKDGDTFTPFGGRTKKLKSYLIDKKIPRRERDRLVVLASGSTILAILGYEISQAIKTDESSKIQLLYLGD